MRRNQLKALDRCDPMDDKMFISVATRHSRGVQDVLGEPVILLVLKLMEAARCTLNQYVALLSPGWN